MKLSHVKDRVAGPPDGQEAAGRLVPVNEWAAEDGGYFNRTNSESWACMLRTGWFVVESKSGMQKTEENDTGKVLRPSAISLIKVESGEWRFVLVSSGSHPGLPAG